MVVGRNNGVVGLTRFQNKEMTELSFGTQKSGRNKEVVVLPLWGGGGGGYSKKFYTERLRPEVEPLTLLYTIFSERHPFHIPSYE